MKHLLFRIGGSVASILFACFFFVSPQMAGAAENPTGVLTPADAIAAVSGAQLECRGGSNTATLNVDTAASDGSEVRYTGYFNGAHISNGFQIVGGALKSIGHQRARQIERLPDGRLRLSGKKAPTLLCSVQASAPHGSPVKRS